MDATRNSTNRHAIASQSFIRQLLLLVIVMVMAGLWASFSNADGTGLDPSGQTLLDERVYIVQLAEPAALNYDGQPGGIAATRPARGARKPKTAFHGLMAGTPGRGVALEQTPIRRGGFDDTSSDEEAKME